MTLKQCIKKNQKILNKLCVYIYIYICPVTSGVLNTWLREKDNLQMR